MAKILEHGNRYHGRARKKPASISKTFLCTACWCKFQAGPLEFYAASRHDGDAATPYTACKCPECGHEACEIDYK